MFTSLSESLVGSVSKLAAAAGAEKTFEEPCYYYRLDQAPDTSLTDLASIRSLQKEDALVVDATWKYRSEHSLPRIQQQISSGLCLGVEAPDGQVAPHTVVCLCPLVLDVWGTLGCKFVSGRAMICDIISYGNLSHVRNHLL